MQGSINVPPPVRPPKASSAMSHIAEVNSIDVRPLQLAKAPSFNVIAAFGNVNEVNATLPFKAFSLKSNVGAV
jgi:hypothetical protein